MLLNFKAQGPVTGGNTEISAQLLAEQTVVHAEIDHKEQ